MIAPAFVYTGFGRGLIALAHLLNAAVPRDRLTFRWTADGKTLMDLQSGFHAREGIRLPLDFLGAGRGMVLYDAHGAVVGGFTLVHGAPLRCLAQIPPEAVQAAALSFTRACELTAVWLSQEKASRRIRYWLMVIGTTLSLPVDGILYSVDASKTKLRERVFKHGRLQTIYEGPVRALEGMPDKGAVEAVECADKGSLTRGFVKLLVKQILFSVMAAGARVVRPARSRNFREPELKAPEAEIKAREAGCLKARAITPPL